MELRPDAHKTIFKAFMFTDLVGSTDLKRRLGDAAGADAISRHDALFRKCLIQFSGSEEDDTGDGFFAAFDVPSNAVRCALSFQEGLTKLATPEPLKVRIGIHSGEIVHLSDSDSDEGKGEEKLVGLALDTASRVMGLAQGGQILLTRGAFDAARQQVRMAPDGTDLRWMSHGPYVFRGLDDPLEIFEVGFEGISPLAPPQKAEKATPAAHAAPSDLESLAWGNFVGRSEELEKLKRSLDAALAGQGRLVMIVGEPGIGKTRLAGEIAAYGELLGARALWGRCHESEAGLPYLPFVEVLRDCAAGLGAESLRETLGEGASVVAKLVPEIGQQVKDLPEAPKTDPEQERYRLFEAVCRFFADVSVTQPLLFVLDDLHWADKPTLMLLQHLARRLGGSRLLVIGTYRDVELARTHPLSEVLAELRRERLYDRIRLRGLASEEVTALVEALTQNETSEGGRALARALYRESEGNPFFIEEIMRHLVETEMLFRRGDRWESDASSIREMGIPEGLKEVIGHRLSRLSEECNRALADAAILGRQFDFRLLGAMAGVREEELLESIEEALRAQLVSEAPDAPSPAYLFTHALVRQTLVEELSLPRRQQMHVRAARAFETQYAGNLSPHFAVLSRHCREAGAAGDARKALDYTLKAAEAARGVFAWEEVIDHWRAALEIMQSQNTEPSEQARLMERLGSLMTRAALDRVSGIVYMERALNSYEQMEESDRAARVHGKLGVSLSTFAGGHIDIDRALEHFHAAEAVLAKGPENAALGFLYVGMSAAYQWGARNDEAIAASQRALQIGEKLRNWRVWSMAGATGGSQLAAAGRVGEGLELSERAWEKAERSGEPYDAWVSGRYRGEISYRLFDPRDALIWYEKEAAKSQLSQAPGQRRFLSWDQARASLMAGEVADTERRLRDLGVWPNHDYIQFPSGEWDGAEKSILLRLEEYRATGEGMRLWQDLYHLAWIRVARLKLEEALSPLEEALKMITDGKLILGELWLRPARARLEAKLGRTEEAGVQLERCREILAGGEDWRGLVGLVALAEGAAASAEGHINDAEAEFERAIKRFRQYHLPFYEAEVLLDWGGALRDSGSDERAMGMYDAATDIYKKIGTGKGWMERVEIERGG